MKRSQERRRSPLPSGSASNVWHSATIRRSAEREITDRIYRQELLDAMPADARELWEMRLLGYSFEEMADERDQSADTLNARARRGAREAIKRLSGESYR
jgi:DNA-directed RNA polymerase specialized sigma24 family protein